MIKCKYLAGTVGLALFSAVLGGTTCAQPSVSVGVTIPLPAVEIRTESDFYEPLTSYGRWEVVGSYGRCWIPGHVESGWRPYSEGYWVSTDAGWYWASEEPWGWATYHYGCWNSSPEFGWYWVPQTRWAPAWVSWHTGGGYVGWAPLYPPGVVVISPQAYVFVQERHFMEPVRRSTLVVNNVTIINKTVIKEAPATAVIEKAGGRKVQPVPVQELRHKDEAAAATRQRAAAPAAGKQARPEADKPAAEPATKNNEPRDGNRKSAPAAAPSQPDRNRPAAGKEPAAPKADQPASKPDRPAQPPAKREQPPAGDKPSANDKGGGDKGGGDKGGGDRGGADKGGGDRGGGRDRGDKPGK